MSVFTRRISLGALILAALLALARSAAAAADPDDENPSGVVQISLRAINMMICRTIEKSTDFSQEFMGATTTGRMKMDGRLSADFVPNAEIGSLEIRLSGNVVAEDSVSQRGRLTIYSSARTTVEARKRLFVDATGLRLEPTAATASTSMEIDDIDARSRLMHLVAMRRAQRMLPRAEEAVSQNIAERLESEIDGQTDTPFGTVNNRYVNKLRKPLVERGCFPRRVEVSTTGKHICFSLLHQKEGQQPPPEVPAILNPQYDIAIYCHESLIANLAESLIGGKTVHDQQLLDFIKTIMGSHPRGLWVHDRSDRWSITLTDRRPIAVKFFDGHFRLTFRAAAASFGNQRFEGPLVMSATYELRVSADGPRLVRHEPVQVRFDSDAELTGEQEDFQSFLRKKFTAFFQPDIYFDGLTPPVGGTWGKLRQLRLVELSAENGWFVLGYQLPDSAAQSADNSR